MSKKYAGVADLLSQMQQQWSEAPDDGTEEDEDYGISQEMLDSLVWQEPQSAPEPSAQVPQANPQGVPSFVTAPESGAPKEEESEVPEEMLNELIWDKEKDLPSFLQPKKDQEPPQISTEVPEWIPEGWQQDIPSFLQTVPYEEIDAPSFLKKDFPLARESNIETVDDAQDLLVQLSKTDKNVFKAIGYVQEALEQIQLKGEVDLKHLADTLGNAIGLLNLISTDDDDTKDAIKVMTEYLQSEVKKLPEFVQERVNKRFDIATQDKKERKPQVFKSKFLDPGIIFVRQKAIKNMTDEGLSKEDAQKSAEEEWAKVESFVDSISDDEEIKTAAKSTFAQHLLDGEDWDKAAEMARKAATSGPDSSGIRQKIRQASFDNDDLDDIIEDLANPEIVQAQFESAQVQNPELLNQIVEFGNLARELNDIVDEQLPQADADPQTIEKVQNISNKLTSLSSDVMLNDSDQLMSILNAYDEESVLEMLWWVNKVVLSKAKNEFGSEGLAENSEMSGSELEAANLSIENKTKKERDPNAPPRKRKRDVEKESDKAYRERIKEHGLSDKFYEVRRKYHEKRPDETEEEFQVRRKDYNDKQFVKKKDYRLTARELDVWKNLAKNPNRLQSKVNTIRKMNLDRTKEFYDRINSRWKYPDDIDKIKQSESLLMRNRSNRYKDILDELSEDPKSNPEVLEALRQNISDVPKVFEEAKSEKLKSSKVAEVIYMINSFLKFAKAS